MYSRSKGSQVVPSGPKWSQVVPRGPKGSQGVPRGPKGSHGIPRGPKWTHGVPWGPKGPQWSQEAPSGPKWSQVVPSGPKWFHEIPWGPMSPMGSQGVPWAPHSYPALLGVRCTNQISKTQTKNEKESLQSQRPELRLPSMMGLVAAEKEDDSDPWWQGKLRSAATGSLYYPDKPAGID